jgi:hypothetical protein
MNEKRGKSQPGFAGNDNHLTALDPLGFYIRSMPGAVTQCDSAGGLKIHTSLDGILFEMEG